MNEEALPYSRGTGPALVRMEVTLQPARCTLISNVKAGILIT